MLGEASTLVQLFHIVDGAASSPRVVYVSRWRVTCLKEHDDFFYNSAISHRLQPCWSAYQMKDLKCNNLSDGGKFNNDDILLPKSGDNTMFTR